MNFDRLDGRIAALELLAGLGLQLYFRARFGADYRGKVREEMDRILADLEAGDVAAPANPMARDEMRHTIRQILLKIAAEDPRPKNGE
jgi:hypothetical protein